MRPRKYIYLLLILVSIWGTLKAQNKTIQVYDNTNSPLAIGNLTCLAIDTSNNVWIGAYGKLYCFNNSKWSVFDSNLSVPGAYLDITDVSDLNISPKGELWGTIYRESSPNYNDLFKYSNNNFTFYNLEGISLMSPVQLYIDEGDTVWFTLKNWWDMQQFQDGIGKFFNDSLVIYGYGHTKYSNPPYYYFSDVKSTVTNNGYTYVTSRRGLFKFNSTQTVVIDSNDCSDILLWKFNNKTRCSKLSESMFNMINGSVVKKLIYVLQDSKSRNFRDNSSSKTIKGFSIISTNHKLIAKLRE